MCIRDRDYETFKHLYRFVERGLMRSPSSAYTILLTLVDDRKQFVTLQDREYLMEKLGGQSAPHCAAEMSTPGTCLLYTSRCV